MHLSDKPRSRGSRAVDEKRKVRMKSAPLKEIARTWLSEKKPVYVSISIKLCMQVFLTVHANISKMTKIYMSRRKN